MSFYVKTDMIDRGTIFAVRMVDVIASVCQVMYSSERNRMVWSFFDQYQPVFSVMKTLHP